MVKSTRTARQEYVQSHPQLALEIKEAILDGQVIRGMTQEQVLVSWGQPTETFDYSRDKHAWWYAEEKEGWIYRPSLLSLEPVRTVGFEKGVVIGTSESYK